ncbi:hypothetical protein [Clostridium butyricum]|uniref:hypothetical protein n=1 Tax=Clostridium butyricum TaxID=1492 RepID=UPI0005C2102A|nr:hypothetical protein [Clostridium butyricum]KIU08812.1 membrane protein [Clostridium butyricum]MBA8965141.1 phage-related protein [Clostridium butyricum]MBA8970302.1 phage-related protein [Clostridium butyricum]MBC2428828.1 hypothetical protein [Clostridium butyricum]NOW37829.1 phage-related protein [Clostridium butyricum]
MSDSVGKISLDLEVKSDLEKQINNMSNIIAKKMKTTTEKATAGVFDGIGKQTDDAMNTINNSIKAGLNKTSNAIRSTLTNAFAAVKNIKMPKIEFPKAENIKATSQNSRTANTTRGPPKSNLNAEAIKAQISNLSATLDNVNAQIDLQQSKLADLKEAYRMAFNPNSKNKIQDQMLKTEQRINNLIGKSDKLGFKLADLDGIFKTLGEVSSTTGEQIESVARKTKKFSSNANKGRNSANLFSNALKVLGNRSNSTGNSFKHANSGISMMVKSMFTWGIVFPMVIRGLSAIGTGLLNNLKTNQQFAKSLAQIQTNLMVAFTPIYQAILPAINSLMSALAKATAYIASFISALFGKTYQQSYEATQQLIDAKEAMGAYGDSAKKAAKEIKGLAGIDEINNLGTQGSDSESGAPTLTPPSMDMSAVDGETAAWAEKFKKILSDLFKPMKQAWDKEGKATMNALKYALSEIWQLIKDIGKSFMEVWTNGTGQKVCENILKVLQTIFKIVGDIAKAFDIAWKKNNLGTKLIQDIFNSLNSVLELLIDIGETFRNVWNSGVGVEICTNILQILDNIAFIIGQIATSFKNAWDSGLGVQIVTDILNLLNGCLRIIQDITSSFSKAWESNGDTICEGILLILDDIFGTLGDIANAWANAWENNGNGDALMNSLLETLGKIFTTIGDIGQGIRESIGTVAEDVFGALIQFCTDVSNGFGALADGLKIIWDNGGQHLFDGIVNLTAEVGELILKITGGAFKDASGIFKDILAPAIGEVFDVVGTLVDKLAEFTDWINNNKPLIDILSAALVGIGTALAGAKIASLVLGAVEALSALGAIIGSVFSGGLISGIVEIGAALVAAVGGWPIIIGAAIVAIGVVIYKNWDEILAWLSNAWQWISDTCAQIWGGIKDFLAQWGVDILAFIVGGPIALVGVEIAKHWDEVKEKTTEIWNSVSTWLGETWEGVKNTCSETWNNIKTSISDKWGEVKQGTEDTWNNLTSWLGTTWGNISTSASTAWETIKTSIAGKWDELKAKCSEIWTNIKTDFDNIITWVQTIFTTGWSNAWNGIKNIFKTIFDSLVNIAKKPLNLVITMVNGVINGINKMISALNNLNIDVPDWVPGIGGESFGFNFSTIPSIPALAKGGIVDSPTLAMVGEAGKEAVMPLENNTGWISDLAGQIASILGTGNNSVSTDQQGGDIVFMLDSSIIGRVALNELIKMRKQGKNVIKLIT